MLRKIFLLIWLTVVGTCILYIFWYQEWQYSLPTPLPPGYHAVNTGKIIHLKPIPEFQNSTKPLFLHFFNPDCPCSRFNITHFKTLVKEYDNRIDFAVIVLTRKEKYSKEEIQRKFNLSLPVVFDSSYAADCGVYSTPQAAIIGTDHRLVYRGNYNKTRYCTDKKTNYAQMAIEALLSSRQQPSFDMSATKSYGCTLPVCSK